MGVSRNRVAGRHALTAGIGGCIAGLGLAAAAYGYGCSVYDTSLLLPAPNDSGSGLDVEDGGRDAEPEAEAEAEAGPCVEIVPPTAPAMNDPSDAGEQSFILALRSLDFGLGDAGLAGLGYDLDSVYTHVKAPACGPESCAPAVVGVTHPDGPGGVDNSLALLVRDLASFGIGIVDTTGLETGQYSILLHVLHYNGTPNDTQVSVALYSSPGVEGDAGVKWNGMDSFAVDSTFVATGDAGPLLPNHLDAQAFVSGGVLVFHLNFPMTLYQGGVSISFNVRAGVVTAP
jgi:hypothetical protein